MCAGDMSSSVVLGACGGGDGVWRVSSLATSRVASGLTITSESRVMYAYGVLLHIGNTVTAGYY